MERQVLAEWKWEGKTTVFNEAEEHVSQMKE